MEPTQQLTVDFLRTDTLRHIAQLKYLQQYGDGMICEPLACDGEPAVLMHYDIRLNPRDHAKYTGASRVVLPVAGGKRSAAALVDRVRQQFPRLEALVFKLSDPLTVDAFTAALPLTQVGGYLTYSRPTVGDLMPDPAVQIADTLAPECLALYLRNHYAEQTVRQYFTVGAQSFTLDDAGTAVCSCMIFPNYEQYWEIGALHTLESARRRGYGRRVVQTALYTLLTTGRIPRYQVDPANTASIRLAEALGLTLSLDLRHYRLTAAINPG